MIWTEKYWLWGLWLLPILAWLFRHAAVAVRRSRNLFAEPEMAERLAPPRSGAREALRGVLITAGMAFLLVAAAGPRGAGELVRVKRKGADIQILLDISRSMLSDDVRPNRLESAKLDINDLLEKTGGDRVGLIAFAGRPTVKIPLTSDSGFFREVLRTLSVADAPRGGTAIGEAIRLALRSVDPESTRERAILLITDGEDHESDPLEVADEAVAMGVRIYTVALGDAEEGGRIPLYDERGQLTGYQKYKGKEIRTKADRGLLRQIAEKTGGAFLDMGETPTDLGTFYRKSVNLKRSGYGEEDRRVWKEKFQPFLLTGLLLLIFGCGISPRPIERKAAAAFLFAALTLVLPSGIVRAEPPADDDIDFFAEQADDVVPETEPAGPETADEPAAPTEEGIDPNLTAEELYNTACSLIEQGETGRAILCLQRGIEETRPSDHSLRGKLRYNLGILQAGQLEKEAEKIFREEDRETDADTPVPEVTAADPETGVPRDAVAEYRRGAAERNAALAELRTKAARAAATLGDAAADGDKKLREDALRSGDLVLSWSEGKTRAFAAREREKRAGLFQPADQLRWLDEELTRLSEADVLSKEPRRAEEWQRIYELAESLADRKADLEDLLEKGTFRDDEKPEISAARLEAAERGLAALNEAAETFGAGEKSALDALREGIGQLDLAALSYADYQTLLFDAVERQEETVKRLASPASAGQTGEDAEPESSPVTQEGIAARDGAILRRLDRMVSDAREEFAQRPYTEEEHRAASQDEAAPAATGETQEEAEDGFFADDTDGKAASQAEPPEELSGEDRIRRSMNLALELAPEVTREEDALAALSAESFRAEAPAHEETVLELLRRIAEPLRDPNQQNQDQQNQNQQNQNQQNQQSDQDQNQNRQDRGQQENQDQQSDQNAPENSRNENREEENRQGQNDQDGQERNQDQQAEGDQEANREEMTPEEEKAHRQEEKAESMMRKVDQRQRQVETLRRQRERLFHRYEKPEKDW